VSAVLDAVVVDGGLRQSLRQPLYRNGLALVANAGLSSLLGVVYWVVVTHLLPAEAVGVNAALVAAMTALSNAGQLSLGSAVASYVPRTGEGRARLVARCYALAVTASIVLGVGFVLVAPRLVRDLQVLRTPWVAATFVGAVVVWSLFALQDNVLTALRRAVWVPLENVFYSAAKLGLVVAVGASLAGVGVFVSWVVPALLCLVPVNVLIFRRLIPQALRDGAVERPASMPFRRFVTGETSGVLLWQVGTTMLPILVVARLGAGAGARFAIPWLLAQAVDLVAVNMGVSLTVEGAHDHPRTQELLHGLVRRALPVIVAIAAVGIASAPLVLRLYGHGYSGASTPVLRLLLLACVPRAVVVLAICAARAELALGRILVMQSSLSVTVPVVAWVLLGHVGVTGAALGWFAGHVVAAAVAYQRGWVR
jgi:O-antigen/teichoic acid export membrane protein